MKESIDPKEEFKMKIDKKDVELSGFGLLFLPRLWNPLFLIFFIVVFLISLFVSLVDAIVSNVVSAYELLKDRKNFVQKIKDSEDEGKRSQE